MHAEHVLGPLGHRGDRVDVEIGGVGGEDRAGLGDRVEPLEHALFQVHVLEHRFDHQVRVGQRIEVEGRRKPGHPLLDLRHRQAAFFSGVLVVPPHDRDAAVERLFRGLDDSDRDAAGEEIHGDAAAHGAGADHADLGDLPGRRVSLYVGDLRRLPLGEKDVALSLGLRRLKQRHEHGALLRNALVEGKIDRVPDRLDCLLPGLEAAELARIGLADGLENLGMAARRLELVGPVPRLLQGRLLGDQPPRVGDRGLAQPALLGEFVDHAPFLGLARAKRRPGQNDVQRLLDADQPRQALRAAGAGDKAELDLGQAAFGRRNRDAIMRGQRHLEPAAERRPMQRGDHRLRGVLDSIEDLGKVGRGRGLAEFGNVGAGDEGPPVADDNDRLDRAVRLGLLDAPIEAVADGLRQSVHRRRVDRDQRDFALNRKVGDRIDGGHGVFPLELDGRR